MPMSMIQELRFRRLLSVGYFPSELPPPFSTRSFATHASEFAEIWTEPAIRKFWTKPEAYSAPRHGKARRSLAIVNPVNQLLVSKLVAENWIDIREKIRQSDVSEFLPSIQLRGGRAVSGVDFNAVRRRRVQILSRYGNYVQTDIARFYPSIYTHAVPWALLGKAYVKLNMNSGAFKSTFANRLDSALRAGQEGQTVGIPIGPDTSRIVAELIACEIEKVVASALPDFTKRAVRYVDDIIVGYAELESPDAILSKISSGLYEYELELNAEKTTFHGINRCHPADWRHFVRHFQISRTNRNTQREDLDSFFDEVIRLDEANPRENVLLYAAKRAATFLILDSNRNHLFRWFLYVARRSPSCLSFVVEHSSVEHKAGRLEIRPVIARFIASLIETKAEAAHTSEVAWLLFWARELGIKIAASSLERVSQLRSSVVALLCLDLRQRGLIDGKL